MEASGKGKIYYSMGEVSEMFDVNPSLLRFWEQKFDIIKPHKNKKGNRLYTPRDIEGIKLIYHLVKERGMTLSGAAKQLKTNREGIRRDAEVIERLITIRSLLAEIRQELKVGSDGILDPEEIDAGIPDTLLVETDETISSPDDATVRETEPEYSVPATADAVVPELFHTPGDETAAIVEELFQPSDHDAGARIPELFQPAVEEPPTEGVARDAIREERTMLTETDSLIDAGTIDAVYISELTGELDDEAVTEAEVMATIAEMENKKDEPPAPAVYEQTLF